MSQTDPIPILLGIDFEPDARLIYADGESRPQWAGARHAIEIVEPLRGALARATGSAAHLSWFLRIDEQIARTHGSPEGGVRRFRPELDRLARAGDEIGLHPHLWRWDEARERWVADFADAAWTKQCLTESFAAFARVFCRGCRSVRIGDRWTSARTLAVLDRLGARFDLSVEPGREPEDLIEPFTGALPDYTDAPRLPYRPSRNDFLRAGRWRRHRLWLIPLTTGRPDWAARVITERSRAAATRAALRDAAAHAIRAQAATYEGWHERADAEAIGGWVYDAMHPEEPVSVDIHDGNSLIATVRADALRPDLRDAGKGDGRHGFLFPVPDALRDGAPHAIRVCIAGTEIELHGTPMEFRSWREERRRCDYEQLNPALTPSVFCGMVDAVLTRGDAPYLALVTSSASLRHADQRANFEANVEHLITHPWASRFRLTTPAETIDLLAAKLRSGRDGAAGARKKRPLSEASDAPILALPRRPHISFRALPESSTA